MTCAVGADINICVSHRRLAAAGGRRWRAERGARARSLRSLPALPNVARHATTAASM